CYRPGDDMPGLLWRDGWPTSPAPCSCTTCAAPRSGSARTAVVSEVPVDDRDLSLVCHARTADHAELTVPLGITHRIAEPDQAGGRLGSGIDPRTGRWRGAPPEALATLLGELAQQPVLAGLARQTR